MDEVPGPNEEHYRELYEEAPLAYASISAEGRIVESNRRLAEMLGLPGVDQLIGRPVLELYADTPSGKGKAREVFERFREGEEIRDEELEVLRVDGQSAWISLTVRPIRDAEGRVVGSRSMSVDITARKRAEEALRANEEIYRDLFDAAPFAYFSVAANGRIRKANLRAAELLGCTLEELIGRPVLELYADTPTGKERAEKVFERFRAGEEVREEELEMSRADGRSVWISLTVRPVRDREGRVVASRSLAIDITARVQAEEALAQEVLSRHNYHEIVGNSPALRELLKQVELVAPTDSTVLILGETGTGKELICRAIHQLSPRSARPLVTVNCAAIPAGLIESELFGHEKGAFTGAITRRRGRFEQAHGGTLFLDEVGDLPLEMQPKLLRVLQEKTIERVGGERAIEVDVRVIAATHRDLRKMARDGEFREDLFYRLNVFPLTARPLRERREDIPALATLFARRKSVQFGRRHCRVSDSALKLLMDYGWPGNVRELQNVMERAVILCKGSTIDPRHVLLEAGVARAVERRLSTWREFEREQILAALRAAKGKISGKGGAAEILDLKPTTLESKMKRLGIRRRAPQIREIP